jgi:hypothetical protein
MPWSRTPEGHPCGSLAPGHSNAYDAVDLREEPSAGKPHARIFGGEAEWPSYSTTSSCHRHSPRKASVIRAAAVLQGRPVNPRQCEGNCAVCRWYAVEPTLAAFAKRSCSHIAAAYVTTI